MQTPNTRRRDPYLLHKESCYINWLQPWLEPELCVCSSEKLGLDKLERGFVNKVLGNERSAELGCGTELISL